jgi:hypothetical protein
MTDEACRIGDYAIHKEESYTFAYYNRNLLPRKDGGKHDLETGNHGLIMGQSLHETGHTSDVPVESEISAPPPKVETKKEA